MSDERTEVNSRRKRRHRRLWCSTDSMSINQIIQQQQRAHDDDARRNFHKIDFNLCVALDFSLKFNFPSLSRQSRAVSSLRKKLILWCDDLELGSGEFSTQLQREKKLLIVNFVAAARHEFSIRSLHECGKVCAEKFSSPWNSIRICFPFSLHIAHSRE